MVCQENGENNQKVGMTAYSCDANTLDAGPGFKTTIVEQ